MTDDHGDQFPGALPSVARTHRPASDERIVRMHAEYLHEAASLVEAGRDDRAHEVAEPFAQESGGARRSAGQGTPTRAQGGRPGARTRLGRITRGSLARFDRYRLEVFHPGAPTAEPSADPRRSPSRPPTCPSGRGAAVHRPPI